MRGNHREKTHRGRQCEKERRTSHQRCCRKICFCFCLFCFFFKGSHAGFATDAAGVVTVRTRAVTLLQSETDVLYLRMIGVNMQSGMQCVGGWVGRGMTIGFRERAM